MTTCDPIIIQHDHFEWGGVLGIPMFTWVQIIARRASKGRTLKNGRPGKFVLFAFFIIIVIIIITLFKTHGKVIRTYIQYITEKKSITLLSA